MATTTITPGQNPGAYTSRWEEELEAAARAILERPDFRYDPGDDALFAQYRDRYIGQGRLAMQDTMGQAAALTGGYGNSYAQQAGQQAYGTYLQGINDLLPELYAMALERYTAQSQTLNDRYATLAGQEDRDYGQYRDQVADWQFQQEFDEDKRRYDQEWEAKNRRGGGGGGGGQEDDRIVRGDHGPAKPGPIQHKPHDLKLYTDHLY